MGREENYMYKPNSMLGALMTLNFTSSNNFNFF